MVYDKDTLEALEKGKLRICENCDRIVAYEIIEDGICEICREDQDQ